MDDHSRNRPFNPEDDDDRSDRGLSIPEQDLTNLRSTSNAQILHYWNGWRNLEQQITPANWKRMKKIWGDIETFENSMKPLEKLERDLWSDYVRSQNGSVEDELDEDELRKAIQEQVATGDGDTFSARIEEFEKTAPTSLIVKKPGIQPPSQQVLEYLHILERLRYRKARSLDLLVNEAEMLGVEFDTRFYEQRSDPQAISEKRSTLGKHFWAVVVGINSYDHLPPSQQLGGCVKDTQLIVGYLTSDLGVPEDHILLLTSESPDKHPNRPNRDRIVSALYEHLRDNPLVQYNDNLLFHFSGHGSSYEKELGHLRTEALCPCDHGGPNSVPDISDRELNIIFSEISRKKGPNLTVILDCCHSGGATRDAFGCGSSDVGAIRGIAPLLVYAPAEEDAIVAAIVNGKPDPRETRAVKLMFSLAHDNPRRMSGSQSPLAADWKSDTSSHVLLAACKPAETAKELRTERVGVFTYALISALTSPRGRDPAMTYATLCREVIQHPHRQTPVVVGERKNSRLWFEEGNMPGSLYNIRGLSSI